MIPQIILEIYHEMRTGLPEEAACCQADLSEESEYSLFIW
jgi:hypothetical protein